jgi:signal transduction histidine kinase
MLMGATFQQAFPELWGPIQGVFEMAKRSGLAANVIEIPLMTERNGYLEETYFTGNFNPIRDVDGSVGGFYNAAHEITKQKIGGRRSEMLNSMVVPSGLHKGTFASYVIPALESNKLDITMALLYVADEETIPGRCSLLLRGSIGVPPGHKLAIENADLRSSEGLIPLFQKAQSEMLTLPVDERFDGLAWRGFDGEPSKHFSILPLSAAGRLFGFLVLGVNSRRAIDEEHRQFMCDITSKVSVIAASIFSADETSKRADRLMNEPRDSERQIRYMAQNASVGMQHLSVDGTTIWANDQYYKLTGHSREEAAQYKLSFIDVFIDEDQDKALDTWNRLINGEPNNSVELRLKRLFTPPSGDPEPACILALSFPYAQDGVIKSIMTCVTDVSQLKWAESIESRKAVDAREAKRQQEEFIDIVAHEMRNPLSAIFQCADMIQKSLKECQVKGPSQKVLLDALQNNADAATTILMCASHQKRIVDDVLTLSKLEYMMLSVSPRAVQPVILVERSIRMFESDLLSHQIKIAIIAEPSLNENNVDWILCDPSRVAQIFINLLTNAIKFTRAEFKREITVHYGVTASHPREQFPKGMKWAPSHEGQGDLTSGPEWGDGELLYLTISITDTGVGMTAEEIKKLFHRFGQASSKTSIKYGGSGLGLFISQKLTEKQGGEVGVVSDAGKGSTFAFYVKARRTEPENANIASQIHRPQSIHSKSMTGMPSGLPPADVDHMHVLLVEDNIVNQKVLSKQLTKAGCTVHIANHGLEALNFIQTSDLWHESPAESKHLDIILMDWEMPVMDGLACCREIRALQKAGKVLRHIEIIAITANAREEQIQNALESGIVSPIFCRVCEVVAN